MLTKMRFIYNCIAFGLYDDAEAIIGLLGEQVRPSEKILPFVGNTGELDCYYFKGFPINADANGKIRQIMLNEWDAPDDGCATVTGIKLGSNADEVKAVLGDPADDNGGQLDYKDEGRVYLICYTDRAVDKHPKIWYNRTNQTRKGKSNEVQQRIQRRSVKAFR